VQTGDCPCSVDSVLFSREVDPAELLMDLGFGGQSSDLLTRIPARFFQPSQVTAHNVNFYSAQLGYGNVMSVIMASAGMPQEEKSRLSSN
jgi:hypothetical protein